MQSCHSVDMALLAVVSDSSDKVLRFTAFSMEHSSTTGTQVTLPIRFQCAILHIMPALSAAKNRLHANVICLSVFGMNMFLPDLPGTIHILRRKSKGLNQALRPAGKIILHITDEYVRVICYEVIAFKKSIQFSLSFRCDFFICHTFLHFLSSEPGGRG